MSVFIHATLEAYVTERTPNGGGSPVSARTWRLTEHEQVDAIDSSTPAGRERLKKIVATLLNSYLAQLLESGFLHADPHP